jgi:SPP1 gp7 family putative phage head morphogenesis protein
VTERLVDRETTNLYLFDMLFRHQVYLEGVKVGMSLQLRDVLTQLYDEFAKFIGQVRYASLDQFTRVELNNFVSRFEVAQTQAFNRYTQQLRVLLKDFLSADTQVSHSIFNKVSDATIQVAPPWGTVLQAFVPATGQTINDMLNVFASNAITSVTRQIKVAYTNNQTPQQLLATIVGTPENSFGDGKFARFSSQNTALLATVLQHISSIAQADIAKEAFTNYQWVSILDSRTTLICRERNGNVYVYNEGPLPPAHYNCRSKAVPLQGNELHDIPNSFSDWAVNQPHAFLNDALVPSVAVKVVAGTGTDISLNDAVKALTISQFLDKIKIIVM